MTPETPQSARVPSVVILGGGFAGAYCARALERILDACDPPLTNALMSGQGATYSGRPPFDITLVTSENYLVYQPMLAEVVSGNVGIDDTVGPLRTMLRRTRIFVREIESVDVEGGTVTLAPGVRPRPKVLHFDHLVVTVGSVTNFRGLPGLPEHALPFKTLTDAIRLRNHIIHVLEQAVIEEDDRLREQLLTFVVAGGGFSGTEVVAEINDFVRRWLRDNAPGLDAVPRIVLIHSGRKVLESELTPGLSTYATELLEKKGVELRLGSRLDSATPSGAILSDGSKLPARTLVSTVPSSPNPLLEATGLPFDGRRLECESDLRVFGQDTIWAFGDCGAVPFVGGGICPPTAQHAVRQARLAAQNIVAAMRGQDTESYRFSGLGKLGSLGHRRAVAELPGGIRLSGPLAWLLWRGIYWSKLPGFDRKIRVGLSWLGDLIVGTNAVNIDLGQADGVSQEHFEPGEFVFEEGDRATGLYMVVGGRAEVLVSRDGTLTSIADIGPGEFFGEMALLGAGVRNAGVRCVEPLDLLFIPCSDFAALLDRLPAMRDSIEQVAEERGVVRWAETDSADR